MPYWKEVLLGCYYLASLPARRRAAVDRAALKREPVCTLFYHRVADDHPNEWTMSRDAFEQQIEWIAEHYDVISLQEAQRRIAAGENRWPSVCLTFDDGYAENCEFAAPLLLRKNLPFTYFVSTNHVLGGEPFGHDLENGVALRPNSIAELRALAEAGVEIGAHTRSHANLGAIADERVLRDEIAGSKTELEEQLGRSIRYFAFPFGLHANLNRAAFRIAHEVGFHGVCSAYGAYNWPGGDPFHIRRIHADPELIRLKNWLTIDPRKLESAEFDPGDYRATPAPVGVNSH
ncbi:Polysaccharide deacetylase [Posidoniimonas polymericola]|uniref:Polysaccharide deacetylase n=1 Tax=Posidoniimonas polymericola TaxID=2528002 RepID=A0A5C5YM40_9BACT|nr:polysaccharide deacetylase family protein [Posidoniimonas polymericola]TWT75915.1 Polysaccharide deacetylase [Posidoniimonas polymericola]